MRIAIPEDEDQFLYVMTQVGSPRLNRRLTDDWEGQYFNDSTLTPREREAIRIRAAHLVGCSGCLAFRAGRDLPGFADSPIPEELYLHVLDWERSTAYTDRERLAIEFMERYALDYRTMAADDPFWDRLREHFSEVELADLCLVCGTYETTTRMYHLLVGIDESCAVPQNDTAAFAEAVRSKASRTT